MSTQSKATQSRLSSIVLFIFALIFVINTNSTGLALTEKLFDSGNNLSRNSYAHTYIQVLVNKYCYF